MKTVIAFLCSCICVCSAFAQEDGKSEDKNNKSVELTQRQAVPVPMIRAQQVWFNALTDQVKGFPAEDGHYLAQNELELQTYYDLGLGYRYLEDPLLRKSNPKDRGPGPDFRREILC